MVAPLSLCDTLSSVNLGFVRGGAPFDQAEWNNGLGRVVDELFLGLQLDETLRAGND